MHVLSYLAVIIASAIAQAPRVDQTSDAAVYVVSYVEVAPPSASQAAALLAQYSTASRKDEGHLRLEALQQLGRSDHFAVIEMWRDQKAFEAHQGAAHTKQFREKLEPLRVSPYDERLYTGLTVGSVPAAPVAGATYAVTHADAIPAGKDQALGLLKSLADASRKDNGNVRFEVLQQNTRQNHFTIVEVWRDQKALDAHTQGKHTRQFRESFQPMSGALYDERLYKTVTSGQ